MGRSGQSQACGRTWTSAGRDDVCQETDSSPESGLGPRRPYFVFFLGWARPQRSGSGTGGRRAGVVGKAWGHAEQRLGFGREPSAPDPWGWEQWLCRGCLAGCPGTSLFSFPAPISRTSPCSLPLRQAHPVRWPPDSTFLRADFFSAAASAHSHSEAGSEAGDRGDAEGGPGGPPWGPVSALRPKGTWGREWRRSTPSSWRFPSP